MNEIDFINGLKALGFIPSKEALNNLDIYYQFLVSYNEKVNLTAITSEKEVYLKHFYDSATLLKVLEINSSKKYLDVGSGAGFPGMVIKILCPEINITFLDSNHKTTDFLKQLVQKLNLSQVEIITDRVEEYARKNKEAFDYVFARAVASLQILSEICLPLVKVEGNFIALKSRAIEEIEDAKPTIKILNGQIKAIENFNLLLNDYQRTLIIIVKVGPTPSGYPRCYSQIKKKPLKLN